MLRNVLLAVALLSVGSCQSRRHKVEDPFVALDKHVSNTLAYHYLWPWSQLIRAAALLDAEDSLEEPQIIANDDKLEVNMNVKRFSPDEIKVTVKNKYITVEGKHKEAGDIKKFLTNHFVQRFVLPPGSKQEEVRAIYKENGILTVLVPKHELPPPPPERLVPIEVIKPEATTDSTDKIVVTTEKSSIPTSTAAPLEELDLAEATTHAGKIRKKELKTTTKTTRDNEVAKGIDGNGLDYALVEPDSE
ncbi:alpha-crystallin B chain-like precursor [Bombyx mori]|uniref:Small heat shock protein 27.4 n=1 Tax=Bombyx mori TaxID=7091 RepID=H9J8I1_BOMMO|nr:alpha-crystallin B chain-like precursor [Bombyx mori]AHA85320.2 small heat shock protein 27.4 [Bombyx mori]